MLALVRCIEPKNARRSMRQAKKDGLAVLATVMHLVLKSGRRYKAPRIVAALVVDGK